MDNKAYLDQIAVKQKVKTGPILSPMLIKLLVAGVMMLITIFIVGSVISGSNKKVTQSYERAYLRISSLASEESPFRMYLDKVKDSDLRSYAQTMLSSLKSTSISLSGIADSIGINPDEVSEEVQSENDGNLGELNGSFENATLMGTIDQTYAAKAYHQITLLLAIEAEARAKTPNEEFAGVLDQSTNDLNALQEQFRKYNGNK